MATYVQSYYLEPSEPVELMEPVEHVELQVPVIEKVVEQATELAEPVQSPVSDYCGFESDDIPPIYRAQLRQLQRQKIIAAQAAEKSAYAYTSTSEVDVKSAKAPVNASHHQSHHDSHHFYVPGYSPPQHNDEVQTRKDHSLPKRHPIVATEHIYHLGKNERSQYVLMEEELLAKERAESPISYTASGSNFTSTESSVLTATLGPAYGALPRSPAPRSVALSKARGPSNEKYAGLSAFRPVSSPIESSYAMPDLN